MATIVVIGNMTRDPEYKVLPGSGAAVCNFDIAEQVRVRQSDGTYRDGEPNYFSVAVWRDQAENVAQSFKRGDRVMVSGRLTLRRYETREGGKGTEARIDADEVAGSARFSTVKVQKMQRASQGQVDTGDDAWATASPTRP